LISDSGSYFPAACGTNSKPNEVDDEICDDMFESGLASAFADDRAFALVEKVGAGRTAIPAGSGDKGV